MMKTALRSLTILTCSLFLMATQGCKDEAREKRNSASMSSDYVNDAQKAFMYANKGDYSEAIRILESLLKKDLSANVRQELMTALEKCRAQKMASINMINRAKNYMRAGNYSAAEKILNSIGDCSSDIRRQVFELQVECERHMN